MLKERISRRDFLILAGVTGAGIAAHEIEKRLPYFQSTSSPEFSQKEIDQLKDFDVVLIFNPGGWGHTPLEEDPGWKEILEKTRGELENRGYKTTILEELRPKSLLSSSSAQNIARKIEQLTSSLPNLKIILTGRSLGASFIESVLTILPESSQILAIEATRPFGNRNPLVAPKRTLLIENSQIDPLEKGNIGEILREGLPPRVFIGKGGDFGVRRLRVDFQLSEHDSCCFWNPEIAIGVEEFLDIHFPSKK